METKRKNQIFSEQGSVQMVSKILNGLQLWVLEYVTGQEKSRCKSKIAILDNVHLKVQTLCYFMLKSDVAKWR